MLSNKQIHLETADILYSSVFDFRGTASGTLAFLHDHLQKLHAIKKISMKFTTRAKVPFLGCTSVVVSPPPTLKTSIEIWKRVVEILVHSASGLEDFELVVDRNFWERAPWKEGAGAVLDDAALCQQSAGGSRKRMQPVEMRNFLVDVARLAGVNLRLRIVGVEGDKARKEFSRGLEREMWRLMRESPYLAVGKTKCVCRKRLLDEACAWDQESKRRKS